MFYVIIVQRDDPVQEVSTVVILDDYDDAMKMMAESNPPRQLVTSPNLLLQLSLTELPEHD